MYELDGQEYSLEQITSAAEQSNLTLDEYVTKAGLKKIEGSGNLSPEEFKANVYKKAGLVKTNDPVQEAASVGSTNIAADTELPSEDGSLELPGRNNFDPSNPLGLPTDVDPNSPANLAKAAELQKIKDEEKKLEEEKKKKVDAAKGYEFELVNEAADNFFDNPGKLEEILGMSDIKAIANRNHGQIPGELIKEIVNSLGVNELVEKTSVPRAGLVQGNEDEVGEGFSHIARKEIYRKIKDRFQSKLSQAKLESETELQSTGYKGINLENRVHGDFNDSKRDNYINNELTGIQRDYAILNSKLNDKSLTINEEKGIRAKIKKLEEYAAGDGLKTVVIGAGRYGTTTKKVNLLDPEDYFIDAETGMNVQADLVNSERRKGRKIDDVTELVENKITLLNKQHGTDRGRLHADWENLNYTQHGWEIEGDKLYKVKINDQILRNFATQEGYEMAFNEKTKNYEWDVPLSFLAKKGHALVNSTGVVSWMRRAGTGRDKFTEVELISSPNEDEKDLSPRDFGEMIYNYHQQGLDFAVDRKAYNKLLFLNKSPEKIEKTPWYQSINKGINEGAGLDSRVGGIYQSHIAPSMEMIIGKAGINISDKQKEGFKKDFSEELLEGVGGFAPILLQFYGLNKVQGAVLAGLRMQRFMAFAKAGDKIVKTKNIQTGAKSTRIVNLGDPKNPAFKKDYSKYIKGKKVDGEEILDVTKFTSGKARFHNAKAAFLNMAFEEAKTQTVGFDTGSGVAFSGINMLLGPFRLKSAFNQLNSVVNKVGISGLTFATAAEGAANFEGIVRHMMGTDDYNDWFEEHYPDWDTTSRRMLMNVILGNGLGLTHTTRNDWRSTNKLKTMRENASFKVADASRELYGKDGKEIVGPKRPKDVLLKEISENQALYSEINQYIKRVELLEYHSSAGKMNEYVNNSAEGIKKEFKEKYGKQLDIEVIENNNNKDFDSDKDKANYERKGDRFEIKINRQNNEIGVMPHEVGHAAIDALFEGNVAIKQEYLESFNKILTGIKLADGRTLLEAIKQEKSITRELTQEEMFTYTAEYLVKSKYRTQFLEQNFGQQVSNSIRGLFERNFKNIKPPKLRPGNTRDLVNFFGRYERSVNKGKGFTKYTDMFLDILEPTGKPKTKSKVESKEIVGVEKIRLKMRENRSGISKLKIGDPLKEYEAVWEREKVLEDQIKRVEGLTEFSVEGLRAEIEKYKHERFSKHRENLELALEEKFAPSWMADLAKTAGIDIKTGDVKASKELVLEAETNIERQILKQRSGKYKGNKILQDNIDLQYNKIAMAALGFRLQKSFDAKAMGLKEAQFNDALSFVTQYKDGIIKRWDPNKEGAGKFSTLVFGNIQPKQALFYEQAFGKGADVTGRITEKTKEIADTSTKTETAPELIDPLTFGPETVNIKGKDVKVIEQYESGLKNIDLSKQDYATLKDVAPEITNKIFGESWEAKKEFIKNNAEGLYNILPLAFRRMAEGTKSSTKINPGVLKNFYVTGERAGMDVGTRAGLPIKAKIPWANASKKFTEMFIAEKVGKDLRNQRTLIKGLQAEIGRAITNSVARRNPNHPENLIQKLADGKSEVLASTILDQGKGIEKSGISDQIFEIYGGAIETKDLAKIQQDFYKAIRNIPGVSYLIIASNLAPSGSRLKNIESGKQTFFASNRKGFDAEVKLAIKEKRILDLHALVEYKNQRGLGKEFGTQFPQFLEAVKAQNTPKYKRQIAKGKVEFDKYRFRHKKGAKKFLDILSDLYAINPKAASLIAYNSNANYSAGKNVAQMRGLEINLGGKKFKIREEHVLQHGQFARLAGEYARFKNTTKNPEALIKVAGEKIKGETQLKEMKEWITEGYFQLSLESIGPKDYKPDGKAKNRNEQINSHAKVDRTYIIDGKPVKFLSELHPVLEAQIQEALAYKRRWKDVTSPLIRMYNPSIAKGKGGSINMNRIEQDGVLHPVKFDLVVPKHLRNEVAVYEKQAELGYKQFIDPSFKGKKELGIFVKKIAPANIKVAKKISKGKTTNITEAIETGEKGNQKAREKQISVKNSKDLSGEFNGYLDKATGIGKEKKFSDAKAAARGARAGKDIGDYFIPVGAEDFAGLMHKTLARGKEGEQQLKFYEKNLYEPYNKAAENITREMTAMANDYRALQKLLPTVPKTLKKFTKGGDFTMEQAVRVAVWDKLGYEIPGLSKGDKASLLKEIKGDAELNVFVNELTKITKGDMYAKPDNNWIAGNIAMDFVSLVNKAKRAKHLQVWQNNADTMFSKENLNKLEAAYGPKYRKTLERTLERMKTGQNRKWGGNATVEKWNDWVNSSVGVIMFLNTKSAVLQTISSINYMNWTDNNPIQAAKAFANTKQYWKDFKDIFNSDYLKDRRGGLKINVNEAELAIAAEKGGARGVIALMLNKGFILTRMADSFAIAAGGAAMFRNRFNRYKKEGMSEKKAKEKAFLDFKAITEETQQSSRADRISEQQASNLGRLLLAFANTPMQYNRIIKRNAQDLFEGRGNRADKLTKIIYYSTVQNFIFNALQKAMFALAFDSDNNEEKEIKKYAEIGEGMADSLLRGSGLTGNAIVAVKNVAMDIANRIGQPNPRFQDAAWEALTISPPISSKAKKLRGAGYAMGKVTKENLFEPSLDNPALSAATQTLSATINLPLDRGLRKSQNIEVAMSEEAEYWQKVALLLGYATWELGMDKKAKSMKKNYYIDTNVSRSDGSSREGMEVTRE